MGNSRVDSCNKDNINFIDANRSRDAYNNRHVTSKRDASNSSQQQEVTREDFAKILQKSLKWQKVN
jgi:hypothetical protein